MTSKQLLLLAGAIGWVANATLAQDRTSCEKIVEATVEAINSVTPEVLEAYLAPDFSFSGQAAQVSKPLFNQLIKQLGDTVNEYNKTGESTADGELTLVYEFIWDGRSEPRTTTFVFDSSNRITKLDMFTLQVKRLDDTNRAPVDRSGPEIIEIAVEYRENIPIAKATINGESRWFAIDSGAPRLTLNNKYFGDETGNTTSVSSAQGVNSSISSLNIARIEKFDLGGITIGPGDVLTMDLSDLEESFGVELYGLVGYEVYKDYDMLFDYDRGSITLIAPTTTENYLATHYAQSSVEKIPIEMRGHIPVIKGKIADTELNLGFDCGAGGNLLDKKLLSSLGKQVSRLKRTALSGAGESRDVGSAKIKELVIGSRKFQNTRTVFNDMSHLNTAYTTALDGLVGYEILSGQKLLLSFHNQLLYFID